MTRISLYVPCCNAERHLARTIEGALRQAYPPDEILIIDDGCTDRTLEIAARYPVRMVRHGGNKGLAAARNTGLRNSSHELVAALDADCVPEADWLEKLVAVLDDPSVAIAGGMLREGVLVSVADRWRQAHMPQDWGSKRLLNPRFVFGNNVIVRKSVVKEVGWYKEEFRTNGEDSDISRRIRAKGYNTFYEPAARVTHLRQDTVRSVMATFWRWHWTGTDGMKLRSMLGRALYIHLGTNVFEFVKQDLRRRNPSLLGLDLLTLLYLPYFDFRAFLNGFGAAQRKQVRAEAKE